jgi:hypothetical protein
MSDQEYDFEDGTIVFHVTSRFECYPLSKLTVAIFDNFTFEFLQGSFCQCGQTVMGSRDYFVR